MVPIAQFSGVPQGRNAIRLSRHGALLARSVRG
uniref:Uncharacterized protein n=1 Tax=Myoviridae sp. ctT3B27 TaxID=2826655 RepID=A0A8S5NA84_9CAUD|nr:MAG TPA: hypothetical protein [Myoviridae sp. ctT3B27]